MKIYRTCLYNHPRQSGVYQPSSTAGILHGEKKMMNKTLWRQLFYSFRLSTFFRENTSERIDVTANLSDSSKGSNFSLPLSTLRIVWLCCCWIKVDWFQFLRFSFWLLSFILFTLAAVFNRSLLESLHFRNYAGFIVWFVVTAVGFSFIRAWVFLVFRRVLLKWDMRKWEKRTRIVLKMLFSL